MRSAWVAIAVVSVLSCGACVGAAWWGLGKVTEEAVGSPEWTADALPMGQVSATLDVRLPVEVLEYRSRRSSYQEWSFEVLFRLRCSEKEQWLAVNRLTPVSESQPSPVDLDELSRDVQRFGATTGPVKSVAFERLFADGGVDPARPLVTLLEVADQCWVDLAAY